MLLALLEDLQRVTMMADTGQRPGGNISQPYLLLDVSGDKYYVAVLNSPATGTVLAADLVCYRLLRLLGWANFEACLAVVDFPLEARVVTRPSGIWAPASLAEDPPAVEAGPHYGTKELPSGHHPALRVDRFRLQKPDHAVAIWVFDSWLGITDRPVSGNLRAYPGGDGRLLLAPIDNGNAFYGPEWQGANLRVRTLSDRVPAVAGTPELTTDIGVSCLPTILAAIQDIDETTIRGVLASVPQEWGFGPTHQSQAAEFLLGRREVLPRLFPEQQIGGDA